MKIQSLVAPAVLLCLVACSHEPSRGKKAQEAHSHMIQALLTYNEQRKSDFSSDKKMIDVMDRLSMEIRKHQDPKRFGTIQGDALVSLVANDTAEIREIFVKRIFDLGLSQPMAMITPQQREVLKVLDTYYKGFLQAMEPDMKAIKALEDQISKAGK